MKRLPTDNNDSSSNSSVNALSEYWAQKSAAYKEQGYVPISMKSDFLKIYQDTVKKSDTQYIDTYEEEDEQDEAA